MELGNQKVGSSGKNLSRETVHRLDAPHKSVYTRSSMTKSEIENRIRAAFPDCHLLVEDLTGTENHYEVRIATKEMESMSRVQRHQSIMKLFDAELKTGELHALAIKPIV